jgi:transposase
MQRDEIEVARYKRAISGYKPKYMIFIDEMSATNRTRRRRFGRFLRGKKALMREHFGNSNPDINSLIAACNIHGMVLDACVITNKNNNRADFEDYVRSVLSPVLGRYPGPNSVVIMDNCSLHFSDIVTKIIEEAGAVLVYLAPYSPMDSPIELCFAQIQKWMKKHSAESQRQPVESIFAAMETITEDNMRAYFRKCELLPQVDSEEEEEFLAFAAACMLMC